MTIEHARPGYGDGIYDLTNDPAVVAVAELVAGLGEGSSRAANPIPREVDYSCTVDHRVTINLSGVSVQVLAIMLARTLRALDGDGLALSRRSMDPDEHHACKCLAAGMRAQLTHGE